MTRCALPLIVLIAACQSGGGIGAAVTGEPGARHREVAWQPWSPEAFETARRQRKLILISVQAAWCHWCHVMNEVTYTDPAVLQTLGEDFVAIRVDADARPDLADRYRDYAWPATAILTPDAEGVVALRGHQPPRRFSRLLSEIVEDLHGGRPIARRQESHEPDPALADLAELRSVVGAQLDRMYDPEHGGWGSPQKYPFAAPVEHLLRRARIDGDEGALRRAMQTLEGHAALIDPVDGGIFQYSVGGTWDEPHYEKIAAIQAGAIHNFAQAHRLTGDERWLAHARQVHRYVREQLWDPRGGYYTSQDADVGTHGGGPRMTGTEYYALDAAGRARVGRPHVDEAVYANLNGMMIRAVLELYEATLEPELLAEARQAADRLLRTHLTSGGGFTHGEGTDPMLHLGDQVEMARALMSLYEVTGERSYLQAARATVGSMNAELLADDGGYYAHSAVEGAAGVFARRRKPLIENGIAARVSLRLGRLDDDDGLRDVALRALRSVANREAIRSHGRKVGEYALALEEAASGYAIVSVVGPADDPRTERLHRSAIGWFHPDRLVELGRPGASRYPYPGEPAAYLCTATACSIPISDPDVLHVRAEAFVEE